MLDRFSKVWGHEVGIKKLWAGLLIGLGYMLSPLSWWNDLIFNLPIALVFGYSISWIHQDWLLPGTLVGYWFSNLLGILMMQFGATDLLRSNQPRSLKQDLIVGLGGSTLYTVIIVALVFFHVLEIPDFLATAPFR